MTSIQKVRALPPPFRLSERAWFLDTNCLSYVLKSGNYKALPDTNIIIASSTLAELSGRSELLGLLGKFAESIPVLHLASELNILKAELHAFHFGTAPSPELLELGAVSTTLLEQLANNSDFLRESAERRKVQLVRFMSEVGIDQSLNHADERDWCLRIQNAGDAFSMEWFEKKVSPLPITPDNFPGLFTYFYSYYFRYVKNPKAIPEQNDFFDLAYSIMAPYCDYYCAEKRFAEILRKQVKGHAPPSLWEIYKKRWDRTIEMNQSDIELMKQRRDIFNLQYTMLSDTQILNYREFVNYLSQSC